MGYDPPRSYLARPASGELEVELDRAIAEYAAHNGVTLRVAFGVWVPKKEWDVGCLCVPDLPEHLGGMLGRRAMITTPCDANEARPRARSHMSAGMRERHVRDTGDMRRDCREGVVDALGLRVSWERRAAAVARAGGDLDAPPLWSLDVHPLVPALAPDFAARLGIDVAAVRRTPPEDLPKVKPLMPTMDTLRVDGRRLIPSDLRIQPGLWIEHWGSMFYVHISDRLPETMLRAVHGAPVRKLMDGLPDAVAGLRIESAIHDAAGTRFTIEEAWTPAAAHPAGDEAWRGPVETPSHWRDEPAELPSRASSS